MNDGIHLLERVEFGNQKEQFNISYGIDNIGSGMRLLSIREFRKLE